MARRTGRERAGAADADGSASTVADLVGHALSTDGAGGHSGRLSSALRTGLLGGKGTQAEAPGLSWTGTDAGKSSSPGTWDDDDGEFATRRPQQPLGRGRGVDKNLHDDTLGRTEGFRAGKGGAQTFFSDSEDEQPNRGRKGKGNSKNRLVDASDSEGDGPIQGFGLKGKGGAKGKAKRGVQSASDDEDPPRHGSIGQGTKGGKGLLTRDQAFGGERALVGAGGKGFRRSAPSPGDEEPRRSRFGGGYSDSDDELSVRGGRGKGNGAGKGEEHVMRGKGGKDKGRSKGMKGAHFGDDDDEFRGLRGSGKGKGMKGSHFDDSDDEFRGLRGSGRGKGSKGSHFGDSDDEFRGSRASKGKGGSKGFSGKGSKGKGKSKGSSFGMF